jgi:hypothetical protein
MPKTLLAGLMIAASVPTTNEDTSDVIEGTKVPEIAEAHGKVDDNTGIVLPNTVLPEKLASSDGSKDYGDSEEESSSKMGGLRLAHQAAAPHLYNPGTDGTCEDCGQKKDEGNHKKASKSASSKFRVVRVVNGTEDTFQFSTKEKAEKYMGENAADFKGEEGIKFYLEAKEGSEWTPLKTAAEVTTTKALKLAEDAIDDLQKLYLATKVITQANETRPVREGVEAIYHAMKQLEEGVKILSKQVRQEEEAEAAQEAVNKTKKKSSKIPGPENYEFDDMMYTEGCPECGSADTRETLAAVDTSDNVPGCICDECGHFEEKYAEPPTKVSDPNAEGRDLPLFPKGARKKTASPEADSFYTRQASEITATNKRHPRYKQVAADCAKNASWSGDSPLERAKRIAKMLKKNGSGITGTKTAGMKIASAAPAVSFGGLKIASIEDYDPDAPLGRDRYGVAIGCDNFEGHLQPWGTCHNCRVDYMHHPEYKAEEAKRLKEEEEFWADDESGEDQGGPAGKVGKNQAPKTGAHNKCGNCGHSFKSHNQPPDFSCKECKKCVGWADKKTAHSRSDRVNFLHLLSEHAPTAQAKTMNEHTVKVLGEDIMREGHAYKKIQSVWLGEKMDPESEEQMRQKENEIETKIQGLAAQLGVTALFDANPESNTIKLNCPDGFSNDDEKQGICVPTA